MQRSLTRIFASMTLVSAIILASAPASAQWVVFDPTNFVKNTITSLQSIKSVAEQVKSYALQVQRYKTELEQVKRLDPTSLVLRNASEDLKNSVQLLKELDSVYGSVASAKSAMETEMRNYSMSRHKSFEDYIDSEIGRVDKEGKGRAAAFQSERIAIQNAQAQMEQVHKIADQIKGPVGIQQSLQTANQQLNMMAAQNAQLMQIIASKQALDNQTAAMEAERGRAIAESSDKAKKMMGTTSSSISSWKGN